MIDPSRPNLFRDDLNMIARHVYARIEKGRGRPRLVWVSPEGFLSSTLRFEAEKAKNPRVDTDIVGLYNRQTTLEQIRADLKARMVEIAQDVLRRAA